MTKAFVVLIPEKGEPRIEPLEEDKICTIANVGDAIIDVDTMESLLDKQDPAEKEKNSLAERLKKLFTK